MEFQNIEALGVPLPEDLLKYKWRGDFATLDRLLGERMEADIPKALRARLQLEREIIARLPDEYPYAPDEALTMMREAVRDFSAAELDALRDAGAADWIFINGEMRYRRNFRANILKTHPEYAPRLKLPALIAGKARNFALLDSTIERMRVSGGLALSIRVRLTLAVKREYVRPGVPLTVHLPLPIEGAQIRNVRLLSASPAPAYVAPADAPQRTVCFQCPAEEDQVFSIECKFENHMRYVHPEAELAEAGQYDFCLNEEAPHIVFTPLMRALAREIAGDEVNPLRLARRVYDYLTTRTRYSYVRSYFTIDNLSEYMAVNGKGDCGLYALTFITLLRILGIPAEWQSGLYTTPLGADCHDWARFYVAPWGWLFVDCSFGNAAHYAQAESRRDFYFGNLDPFRMPAAARFQYPFDPPKRFLRNDPYDNQCGEAEYEDAPLFGRHLIDTQETLSVTELPFREQ